MGYSQSIVWDIGQVCLVGVHGNPGVHCPATNSHDEKAEGSTRVLYKGLDESGIKV